MVIDTSVLVAILLREPEHFLYREKIQRAKARLLSSANFSELGIVLTRRWEGHVLSSIRNLLSEAHIDIVPVDEALAEAAISAYAKYGRGIHPAGLNYGDCFAYALAKSLDVPLLFKGTDFDKTDVLIA